MAGSNIFLSIVVPFYNEADNIIEFSQELQKTFKDYSKPWEIVFVDDGSTDDSIEKLKASIEDETNCRIVKLSANVGRNAALCAGLNYADGRYVGVISADLQYHPSQLLKLENELGDKKLDMVAGYLSSEPTGKRLGDRMLYSLAVNGRLRDPICSLRIFSRKLIGRIKNYSGNT
ncbi:MAG: glycosyltransferase family 2 protein [Planctomycetota bacterium]|nr:glycosyltransferase family 2 protein [Planctomycetota bacterium]